METLEIVPIELLGLERWRSIFGESNMSQKRNRQMDLLRISFAILVIFSHAQEIPEHKELLSRWTSGGLTSGGLAVIGFFLLSGYLIVRSWDTRPVPSVFLTHRILRIVPGYMVAAISSTVILGLVAPAAPGFFSHLGWKFFGSLAVLFAPVTPPVFPGFKYQGVNGSLWTISYEFFCYLSVLLWGITGLLKKRSLWAYATLLLLGVCLSRIGAVHNLTFSLFRFTLAFFVGGCFYLYRERISFHPVIAILCALSIICMRFAAPSRLEPIVTLFGAYVLFYLVRIPIDLPEFPDISYGVYLYGWPVEAAWIYYMKTPPWITFLAGTAICIPLALLSWNLIEKPALSLKKRSIGFNLGSPQGVITSPRNGH
jgi:peptidoglycan/LPS O-acetylase OafA/YrhL